MEKNQSIPTYLHLPLERRLQSLQTILMLYPLIALWLVFIYYFIERPMWSLTLVTSLSLGSAVYGLLISSIRGTSRLNFVVVYGLYLSMAHIGLVASDIIVPRSLEVFVANNGLYVRHFDSWYYPGPREFAVALSGIGITSFFLGAGLFMQFGRRHDRQYGSYVSNLDRSGDGSLFYIGLAMLILCTIYLLGMILLGLLPLTVTYGQFFVAKGNIPGFAFFIAVLAVGLNFMVAASSKRQLARWIIWFIIPAFLLLFTGNRGEAFYASAAAIAILSARGYVPRLKSIVIFIFAFFVVIPSVRQLRGLELADRDLSTVSINLTDPIIEIGFQIRPLMETIRWIDGGEELANGGTYWLPIQRILGRALPLIDRPPIDGNRLDVQGRTPTQGYSVFAEAYFNFAVVGVIIIPGAIGFFLSYANRTIDTQRLAFVGAITSVLINNLRNSFIFVPGQVILVSAFFLVAWQIKNSQRGFVRGKIKAS